MLLSAQLHPNHLKLFKTCRLWYTTISYFSHSWNLSSVVCTVTLKVFLGHLKESFSVVLLSTRNFAITIESEFSFEKHVLLFAVKLVKMSCSSTHG